MRVFGWCKGAFAEYACAAEGDLLPKPANLTSEQSAAVGDSAFTALAAVRDQGKVQPGDNVLINGASGGVGTFAVQIAKAFGANVTGVCSTRNLDAVRSLGADHVIDYTREDFAQTGQRYDVMLDLVGTRSLSDCRRALTPRGTYVVVGVKDMGRCWVSVVRSRRSCYRLLVRQRMRVFVVRHNREDLGVLKEFVEAGKIAPVIDMRFALRDVPDALRYQGEGHARGKIVIVV
jgi:NADPH:quinone reductase-like Zn-dependent oxidoreductase